MLSAVIAGFALGGGLIVAIGAQNAYVIRQGILNQHIFLVCLFCALSDALLIWAGTFGLSALIKTMPALVPIMTWGGVAFLTFYGIKALVRALNPSVLSETSEAGTSLLTALATCAAFTFLNPHVYLDTVVLVGSIANSRPLGQQAPFAAGATLASFLWFFAIGYGARMLRKPLSRPVVWRMIDFAIAVVMFSLAAKLVLG